MISGLRDQHTEMPYAKSNSLRNKSTLVMGIGLTFTCFRTRRPRKLDFLHETEFSLPHRSIPHWLSKFFRLERASIWITWNLRIYRVISTSKFLKEARESFYAEGGLVPSKCIPRATNARQCVAFNARPFRVVNNNGGRNCNKHLRS